MKMIKIILRNGSHYTVDQFKFEAIIASQNQIIMLTNFDSKPTYQGFNKADIVEFMVDKDATDSAIRKITRYLRAKKASMLDKIEPHEISIGVYAEDRGAMLGEVKMIAGEEHHTIVMGDKGILK